MVFTIRRRYVQISAVIFLLFLLISTLLSRHAHSSVSKGLNYIDSLTLLIFSERKPEVTDKHSEFNQKVSKLLAQKQKDDSEDKFWAIDTELTADQTQLTIPSYFKEPVSSRPVIGPFDPRFTLAIYYSYIARHPETLKNREVPFHWSDWVDMTPLNKYFFSANKLSFSCDEFDFRPYQDIHWPNTKEPIQKGAFDPKDFCRLETASDGHGLGFVVDQYFGRLNQEYSSILGKAFLYTLAPNPYSVTFLTKDGSYTVEISREKSKFLNNSMVGEYLKENGMKMEINTLEEFRALQKKISPVADEVFHDYEVHIKHEDFLYEPSKVVKELEQSHSSGVLKSHEVNYLNSVRYSMAEHKSPPKYFKEARIFDTVKGDHYDWRFFNGFRLGTQEQTNTLHRLVRSWLSFTRKQGITTWMAHGSLLSWYWNGVAFPWDNDIDVQVPMKSLHKLSLKFNQSLIVEDSEDGFGRYFLDCGSFIATRNHNNGNNNIDARYIDIDSGLYIDITGLAVSSDASPSRYHDLLPSGYDEKAHSHFETNDLLKVYNCRNDHFSSHTELSPLVKTFVEGEVAYVPKRYSDILTYEYDGKGMLQNFFAGHLFIPQLRLWIHQDTLRFFLRHRSEWKQYYSTPDDIHSSLTIPKTTGKLNNDEIKILLGLSEDDFLDLLLADDLLLNYVLSRELTSVHETEIMRLLFGKTTQDVVTNAPDFKPLMYEPYLYRLNRDLTTFDARVETFVRLNAKLELDLAAQAARAQEAKSEASESKNHDDHVSDDSAAKKEADTAETESEVPKGDSVEASDNLANQTTAQEAPLETQHTSDDNSQSSAEEPKQESAAEASSETNEVAKLETSEKTETGLEDNSKVATQDSVGAVAEEAF